MKKTTILILCTLLAFLFVSCAPDSTPTPATPTPPPTGQVEMTENEKAQAFIKIYGSHPSFMQSFEKAFTAIEEDKNKTSMEIDSTFELNHEYLLNVINFYLNDYDATLITKSEVKSGKITYILDEKASIETSIQKIENAIFTVTFTAKDANGETKELTQEFNLSFDLKSVYNKVTEDLDLTISFSINGKNYNITAKAEEGSGFFTHATFNEKEIDPMVLKKIMSSHS